MKNQNPQKLLFFKDSQVFIFFFELRRSRRSFWMGSCPNPTFFFQKLMCVFFF